MKNLKQYTLLEGVGWGNLGALIYLHQNLFSVMMCIRIMFYFEYK